MTIQEFENLTGIFPSQDMYRVIEDFYMENPNQDKIAFCKEYKENKNGLAEKIQITANKRAYDEKLKVKKDLEISLQNLKNVSRALEVEQEWRPYQYKGMISDEKYRELVNTEISHPMTDEDAKKLICDTYGFEKDKIQIVRTVESYEKNRHGKIRVAKHSAAKSRCPYYASSDWNYILFSVLGNMYEYRDGGLFPTGLFL